MCVVFVFHLAQMLRVKVSAARNILRAAHETYSPQEERNMKLILECLVAIILHPVAVVLVWIDEARRTDMPTVEKVIWGIVALIWGIGPILYILLGGGTLWGERGLGYPGTSRTRRVA
jgi:hypothetical protein